MKILTADETWEALQAAKAEREATRKVAPYLEKLIDIYDHSPANFSQVAYDYENFAHEMAHKMPGFAEKMAARGLPMSIRGRAIGGAK